MPPSDAPELIAVSPFHRIEMAEDVAYLLREPREKDFALRTIARKAGPDGRDLARMELVVAGRETLAAHPLARTYPVHFVKTYNPWSFHGDPCEEFANHTAAARILGIPEPIGCDANTFRTSFLPGIPLDRLSPFTNIEPQESCLGIAQLTDTATLIGLWKLAEEVYGQLCKLHAHGFFHRDMELHNLIVSTAPVHLFVIDFESALRDFHGTPEEREALVFKDCEELFRLAIYLQSGLGYQAGPLAEASLAALPRLFREGAAGTFTARLQAANRKALG